MTAFLPPIPRGLDPEPEHPRLQQRPSTAELHARRVVSAARWRARELAELVFGSVDESTLVSMRDGGPFRGLVRFQVPFDDLDAHRDREERFLAVAGSDPLLSQVPLVYVIGPRPADHA